MAYSYQSMRLMPPTPKLIKYLVIFALVFGCLSGFFHSILGAKLGISFLSLFGLSAKGLFSGFIWQPLTYLFLPQIEGTLSFYFLFSLSFDLYLLWFIGCKVYHLFGSKTTLKLFFIPPLIAGVLSSLLGYFLNFGGPLFGLSFAMIPLIFAFCFSKSEGSLHFAPMRTLQTRWLGLGLVILYLIQDLANLDFTAFIAHTLVCLISYFYLTYFHGLKSPFSFTDKLDNFIQPRRKKETSSKVIYLYDEQIRKESKMDKTFNKMKNNQKLNIWDKIKLRSYRKKDS